MRLQQLARTQQAVALLKRGMRTTLVQRITGLRAELVRELRREIHEYKPKPGQLPSTHAVLDSVLSQASASLFIALYRAIGGPETEPQIQLVRRCCRRIGCTWSSRIALPPMGGWDQPSISTRPGYSPGI